MLLDARHMTGPIVLETPEQVEATWYAIAAAGNPPREIVESKSTVEAYVSDSRWVADCPFCPSGIAVTPEWNRACCLGCYRIVKVKFPAARTRERAEALLLERAPINRHWRPDSETVKQLAAENEDHADEISAFQGR